MFEVDLAAISRAEAATVAKHREELPETNVVRVEIDFESQSLGEVLADAGFHVGALTFFVWEGEPMYLTRAAVRTTLDAVHALSAVARSSLRTCGSWSTNRDRSARLVVPPRGR